MMSKKIKKNQTTRPVKNRGGLIICAPFSDSENDCVLELKAFVRGGMAGVDLLNRVLPGILTHFNVQGSKRRTLVLSAAGLSKGYDGRLQPARGGWGAAPDPLQGLWD